MDRRDDVSPIEVSPNQKSWISYPLYDLTLGLIIPDRCVPILDTMKELVVTRQFGLCNCNVPKLTGESRPNGSQFRMDHAVARQNGSEFRISSWCSHLIVLTCFRDLSQQNVTPINHSDILDDQVPWTNPT
jgi:hypothetical protein